MTHIVRPGTPENPNPHPTNIDPSSEGKQPTSEVPLGSAEDIFHSLTPAQQRAALKTAGIVFGPSDEATKSATPVETRGDILVGQASLETPGIFARLWNRTKELVWGSTPKKIISLGLSAVAATGVIVGVSQNRVEAAPGTVPTASGPATPGAEPSPQITEGEPAPSVSVSESPDPAPTNETEKPVDTDEKVKDMDDESDEKFFERPLSEQVLFHRQGLDESNSFPYGVSAEPEERMIYNFNPNDIASIDNTDDEILQQLSYAEQFVAYGRRLGSDANVGPTEGYDPNTARKNVSFLLYDMENTDRELAYNVLKNIEDLEEQEKFAPRLTRRYVADDPEAVGENQQINYRGKNLIVRQIKHEIRVVDTETGELKLPEEGPSSGIAMFAWVLDNPKEDPNKGSWKLLSRG